MKTVFYANINKKCISYKIGDSPIAYMSDAIVKIDGFCKVSTARHKAIVQSGSREVCARVHTTDTEYAVVDSVPTNVIQVSYNPKKFLDRDYFYRCDNGQRVDDGVFYLVHDVKFDSLNNVKLFMEI